ncbi:sulfite exporter TauE/SafE family protein [Jiella endophytica]|uniref:Probable membrane transporter protein n=1 Tax=Jiella endophytica TaxID=2558362 RepID=A0A4Y8RL00_9HYPH|nr:sulfite exporter TauE/SafE family protein [Jiella endophytica]TFF22940.1 sulfite exporter TauE/SafE family protein [Jiella endophytica]
MFDLLPAGLTQSGLLFIVATAFVAGLARGFSGFGAALIFVPLASAIVGPKLAAPVLLVIDAVAALGLLPGALRKAEAPSVAVMAIGGAIGVLLGTLLLTVASPLAVRWFIASVVVILLVLLASGWRYHGRPKTLLTIAVGTVSGVFSGAAGTGGPPVVAYWLGSPRAGKVVRANIVAYFAVSTVFTVVSYAVGGLFIRALLPLIVATGPLYAAGLFAGTRLFGLARESVFRWACIALIAGSALVSLPILDPILR